MGCCLEFIRPMVAVRAGSASNLQLPHHFPEWKLIHLPRYFRGPNCLRSQVIFRCEDQMLRSRNLPRLETARLTLVPSRMDDAKNCLPRYRHDSSLLRLQCNLGR